MKIPVTKTLARYRKSDIPEEQGNPLVLALRARYEPNAIKKILSEEFQLQDITNLTASQREEMAEKIHQIRIATAEHNDLYCKVHRMMNKNYLIRNPTKPEVIEWSYDIADPLIDIADTQLNQQDIILPNTTADAIFVSGFSGNGKSTMTERILFKCFPQIIEHHFKDFNEPQITYIKVDIPHDGSRGRFLESILLELDRVLKESSIGSQEYANSVKKNARGDYQDLGKVEGIVLQALNRHYVGVFVIDELQNLLIARKDYRTAMLQLLDTFSNKLFVPTLKIGTPDSRELVSDKSRHLRRLGEPFFLSPLSHDEHAWERAMKTLLTFQPVKKPIERDKRIEDLLANLSAGVPDYLIKLWKQALIEAIRSGKERITQSIIKKVFKQQFPLLRAAINNINQRKSGRYSDLITAQQYFDSGNQQNALKFLDKFSQATQLKGIAAEDVVKDIESALSSLDMTTAQQNKFEKIKAQLKQKAKETSGPQTIEHKL
jgi:hypothetical protein